MDVSGRKVPEWSLLSIFSSACMQALELKKRVAFEKRVVLFCFGGLSICTSIPRLGGESGGRVECENERLSQVPVQRQKFVQLV